MERFGISVNLKRTAHTQYRNFNFNSMCVFNGQPLGASSDGLFSLDDADTDDGAAINAYIELPTSDLGVLSVKRFRKFYVGYETSGSIKISTKADGGAVQPYTLPATIIGQLEHRGRMPATRGQKGTYWIFIIENVAGCDFSLDNLEGLPIVLTKGRR